jgi:hypothetical protein
VRDAPLVLTAKAALEITQISSSAGCKRSIRWSVCAKSARNLAMSAAGQAGARSAVGERLR